VPGFGAKYRPSRAAAIPPATLSSTSKRPSKISTVGSSWVRVSARP
jgi:hypothetical protein